MVIHILVIFKYVFFSVVPYVGLWSADRDLMPEFFFGLVVIVLTLKLCKIIHSIALELDLIFCENHTKNLMHSSLITTLRLQHCS